MNTPPLRLADRCREDDMDSDDVRVRLEDLAEMTWGLAVVAASAERPFVSSPA